MSTPRKWIAACVLAAAIPVAAAVVPVAAEAQDVKYTETSKIEAFMSLPGMGGPIRSTTYVSKGRVRTDNGEQSTVMSYGDMMFTQIDHSAKTFYTMSLADMMAAGQEMMGEARAEMEGARAEAERARAEAEETEPEVTLEFDLKVDRLGEGGRVSGYATERVMLVLKAKATSTTPDPETGEEVSGTMVTVSDMWVAKDFPGFKALQEAQMAAATELSEEMRQQMADMAESGSQMLPPGISSGGGMERMAEEMKKIDGTPIRTLTYQLMLADGVDFDRDAIIDMADKPIPSFSLTGAMGQAAKEGVKNAIRGGLGGLMGRKRAEPKPEEAAAQPGQAILMRITSAIEEVSTAPLTDAIFLPDPNYKEKKPDWMKSSGGI